MQTESDYVMLTVVDGRIVCPVCRRKLRGVRILPDSSAEGLALFCASCKTEHIVNIASGQRVYRPRP